MNVFGPAAFSLKVVTRLEGQKCEPLLNDTALVLMASFILIGKDDEVTFGVQLTMVGWCFSVSLKHLEGLVGQDAGHREVTDLK